MSERTETKLTGTFLVGVLGLIIWIAADQLTSAARVHEGIIIQMDSVPSQQSASPNIGSYGGGRRVYKYNIQVQRFPQMIALVRADDGDTLKVHCSESHFQSKGVGDTLLFKEYKGDVFGIKFLSHSEEDTVMTDEKFLQQHFGNFKK